MEFIKSIIKNKKLIWQLGKSDFKNRFASTSLGSIWGFLQPFVFMFTYVIVFQYILKTERIRIIKATIIIENKITLNTIFPLTFRL